MLKSKLQLVYLLKMCVRKAILLLLWCKNNSRINNKAIKNCTNSFVKTRFYVKLLQNTNQSPSALRPHQPPHFGETKTLQLHLPFVPSSAPLTHISVPLSKGNS